MSTRHHASSDLLATLGGRAGVVTTAASHGDGGGFGGILTWIVRGDARSRQLRHLASLEDHLLDDVGLTRAEVLEKLRRG